MAASSCSSSDISAIGRLFEGRPPEAGAAAEPDRGALGGFSKEWREQKSVYRQYVPLSKNGIYILKIVFKYLEDGKV